MKRSLWPTTAIGLFALLAASPARADEERLGLVDAGPTLREAITTVLEPWNIHVVDVATPAPSATMPEAAREAHALSVGRGINAIAWVSESPGGRSLWLYDARNDQLVSRQLTGDPKDEASAAAVALTLKTLLRSSTIAPPNERLGSTATPASPPPSAPRRFRLEVDGGVRLLATSTNALSPRTGVAAAWWPSFLARRVSFGVRFEEGLGAPIHTREFRGRLGDHDASLFARGSIPLGARYFFEPGLGGTVHWTTLDGAPIDGHEPTNVSRVDPSLDAAMALSASLGHHLDVGARVTGSLWTRWQRYQLDQGRSFEVSPVQVTMGLFVGAVLD